MSRESLYTSETYSKCVFRETFNDEFTTRKNKGIPTSITYSNGCASFNGFSSKIDYPFNSNNVYSVRIRFKELNISLFDYIFDFRGFSGICYFDSLTTITSSGGQRYVDGVISSIVSNNTKEIVVSGINSKGTSLRIGGRQDGVGGGLNINANIELFEIYEGTLTAEEVSDLYNNKRFKGTSTFSVTTDTIQYKDTNYNFYYSKSTDLSNKEDLVAAYNMVSSPKGILTDISGNGNNGTIYNCDQTINGLKFDGIDDRVVLSATNYNIGTSDFTYTGRFKYPTYTDAVYIVGVGIIGGSNTTGIICDSAGTIRSRPFGKSAIYTSDRYDDNQWHTFVHSHDRDGNAVLCIDGVEVITHDISSAVSTELSTSNWNIGAESGSTAYFDGEVAEFRLYNRIWSLQEAKDYHNQYANQLNYYNVYNFESVGNRPFDINIISGNFEINEAITILDQINGKYIDCTSNGSLEINIGNNINIDAIIYFYDTSWVKYEGVLSDLITAQSWLSTNGDKLVFTLTSSQNLGHIIIKKGIEI